MPVSTLCEVCGRSIDDSGKALAVLHLAPYDQAGPTLYDGHVTFRHHGCDTLAGGKGHWRSLTDFLGQVCCNANVDPKFLREVAADIERRQQQVQR